MAHCEDRLGVDTPPGLSGTSPPPPFRPPLEVVRVRGYPNGVVVLRVGGELDLSTAPLLARYLRNHLEASRRGTEFFVDLSEVSFLGANGIAALIDAARAAHLRGCRFAIVGCRPVFVRILDIMGARETLNVLPLDLNHGDRARCPVAARKPPPVRALSPNAVRAPQ